MNFLSNDLINLIKLHKSHARFWILAMIFLFNLQHFFRFSLIFFKARNLKSIVLNNFYFEKILNFQFNELYLFFIALSFYNMVMTYIVIYDLHPHFLNPLMLTLTRNIWLQFVQCNLPFAPKFTFKILLRHPKYLLSRWIMVLKILLNYHQIKLGKPPKLLPFLSKAIRVKILLNMILSTILFNFLFNICSKFCYFVSETLLNL